MSDERTHADVPFRAARRAVFLVFLCFGASYANLVPRIPQLKHALGLGDGALGIALLGGPVGTIVAVRVAGWAIGRFGSRRVTRCGGLAMTGALVLPPLAGNLAVLALTFMVLGAALGITDVAMNAQGVAVERGLGRPVMSGLHGAYSLGGVLGALLGSAAADLGISPLTHLAVMGGVLAVTVWCGSGVLLRDDGTQTADVVGAREKKAARWSAAVVVLGVIGLCSFIGEGAVDNWSAVYLRDGLGTGAGVAGLGLAGCSAAMMVVRLTGDRLVARFGPVLVLRVGSVVSAVGLGTGLALDDAVAAIAGFTVFGVGAALVAPVTFSAAGNLPGIPSGAALSYVTGIGYLGLLLGPPAIGFTAQVAGLRTALAIPAVLAAVIVPLSGTVRAGERAVAGSSGAAETAERETHA